MVLITVFSCFVKALAVAAVVVILLRTQVKTNLIRLAAVGAAALVLFDVYLIFAAQLTPDYHIFWRIGRDLQEGLDPYDPARFASGPFLNPPTALPLFALFSRAPYVPSLVVWTLTNVLLGVALPSLAALALARQESLAVSHSPARGTWQALAPGAMAALSLTLVVSDAFSYGLFTGQLGLLTAVALLLALAAHGRGRRIAAGLWLGLATIKVSTMLPFLVLFLRKRDLPSWITLALTCATLCLLGGSPSMLPSRVSWTLRQIEALGAPGQVNDYSFMGTQNATMIGFDHALFRLGLRDRATIQMLQLIAVLLLGLSVASLAVGGRLPRAGVCSIVALYSVLFFYHRIYDTVLLILPLVYSVSRSQTAQGRSRWWFVTSAIAILLVLFGSAMGMASLTSASLNWGLAGRLVQAVVLPYATWMILTAIACIYLGDARSVRLSSTRTCGASCTASSG
jgi:hypothetical protein